MNNYVNMGGGAFDADYARLQRQQQLADALQQQALDPVQAPQGAVAPISFTNVLAKLVQGYAARRQNERIDARYKDLQTKDRDSANALVRGLIGPAQVGTTSMAPQQSQINATTPQLPGGPAPTPVTAPMATPGAQGTGATNAAPSMQQQLALLLGADDGPQAQAVRSAMLPQLMQRQNLDYTHQLGREDADYARAQPMSVADQQRIAAQTQAAEQQAAFTNKLGVSPTTQAQLNLGYAQLGKPIAVPFGGQMYDPKTRQMFTPGGGSGSDAPIAVDANSNSLNAQTGLSQLALDRLMGTPNQPRTAAVVTKVDKELTDYSIRNNVNLATMRARAEGVNKVITQNVMRNSQANILEHEITGSVQNLGPLLDQMHAGQVNVANVASIWAGRQVNDPVAQQAADQLGRFRNELAGYNAVAGGHLMENGTPSPTPEDFHNATNVIMNGINSGGARAVAQSVQMSAGKNRAVLSNAIDDANQELWDAVGVGKNYKRTAPKLDSNLGGGGGGEKKVVRTGTDKASGKKVVQYSDGSVAYAP